MYKIYLITNLVNHKKYIGLTKNSIAERMAKHIQAAKSEEGFLLHRAIRKYGKENFTIELVEDNLTLEDAYEKEKFYIQKHNTYFKNELGYNMTLGGENAIQNQGENNGRSIASDEMRYEAIKLLKETNLTYKEIALKVGYPNTDDRALRSFVGDLNCGTAFRQEGINYPIRKDPFTTRAKGLKNGNALPEEKVKQIINLLTTTKKSYTEIGSIVGGGREVVGRINRCKTYTEVHEYKEDIRKESQNESK
jgi:group I intron endonuclease